MQQHHTQRYIQFKSMLCELNLDSKYSQILEENGFDEWASVSEIVPPLLKEMGIKSEIDCL